MKIHSLDDLIEIKTEIIDIIYPVGSIFLSVSDINPSTFLNGTWERWGNGRSPLGVDETMFSAKYGDFSKPENMGGEIIHYLSVDELPSHAHTYSRHDFWYQEPYNESGVIGVTEANGKKVDQPTAYTGGNAGHNNMHPYITCYMWKRIS